MENNLEFRVREQQELVEAEHPLYRERVTSHKFSPSPRMLSLPSPANLTGLPPQLVGPHWPTDPPVVMLVSSNLLAKWQSRRDCPMLGSTARDPVKFKDADRHD